MANKENRIPYKSILYVLQKKEIRDQLRLPQNIRFDRYRVNESPQQLVTLLGSDVKFSSHPGVNFNITKRFVKSQNRVNFLDQISENESEILLIASIIHDWGELKIGGLGHGDETFERHTEAHEIVEERIFQRVANQIYDYDDRNYVIKTYKDVVRNKDSKLGKMFNAIERVGYLISALKAYKGINNRKLENWHGLVGNVFSNQIIQLLEYQKDYKLVQEILEENSSLISKAFKKISTMDIIIANDDEPSYNKEKFDKAKEVWEKNNTPQP